MGKFQRFCAANMVGVLALIFSTTAHPESAFGLLPLSSQTGVATSNEFTKSTFTYKKIKDLDIKADVYRASGKGLRPVIIWIHGGGLIFGSREMLPADERDQFLRTGFVVVSIDYRLAPETKLPEILKDVMDAHRWVRDKGPVLYGIDPDRMVDVGQSAGAYLALMAGALVRPRLKAVVSFYGYGNVDGEWYSRPDPAFQFFGKVTKESAMKLVDSSILAESPPEPRDGFYIYCRQAGVWPQFVVGLDSASGPKSFYPYTPERLITAAYPPTLLLHGDRDTDVPFYLSLKMSAALEREHVDHRLYRMVGFNHMFDVFPDGMPPKGKPTGLQNAKVAEAFQVVLSFLSVHSGHPKTTLEPSRP